MAPSTDSTDPAPPPATPTPSDPSALRASDADRDYIAQLLHHACGAGMLTMTETEDRLGAVYKARFRHELLPLTADLPLDRPPLGSHTSSASDSLLDTVRRFLASTAPPQRSRPRRAPTTPDCPPSPGTSRPHPRLDHHHGRPRHGPLPRTPPRQNARAVTKWRSAAGK